jgi:hypothetical protein
VNKIANIASIKEIQTQSLPFGFCALSILNPTIDITKPAKTIKIGKININPKNGPNIRMGKMYKDKTMELIIILITASVLFIIILEILRI